MSLRRREVLSAVLGFVVCFAGVAVGAYFWSSGVEDRIVQRIGVEPGRIVGRGSVHPESGSARPSPLLARPVAGVPMVEQDAAPPAETGVVKAPTRSVKAAPPHGADAVPGEQNPAGGTLPPPAGQAGSASAPEAGPEPEAEVEAQSPEVATTKPGLIGNPGGTLGEGACSLATPTESVGVRVCGE